jgi:hypothetical protein
MKNKNNARQKYFGVDGTCFLELLIVSTRGVFYRRYPPSLIIRSVPVH